MYAESQFKIKNKKMGADWVKSGRRGNGNSETFSHEEEALE